MKAQLGEVIAAQRDGTHIFRLSGEFDLSNAWRVQDALLAALRTGSDDIVVDLAEVRFMDGQLLRTLIRAQAYAAGHDIGFVVLPPRDPEVWRVAQLLHFPEAA